MMRDNWVLLCHRLAAGTVVCGLLLVSVKLHWDGAFQAVLTVLVLLWYVFMVGAK